MLCSCLLLAAPKAGAVFIPQSQQQEPQTAPQPESDANDESTDEEYYDEESFDQEAATSEEEAYTSPFGEIITAPKQVKREISDADWAKMTRDPAYQYEDPAPEPVSNEKYEERWWSKMFGSILLFFASGFGNVIIIALVALLILFIIFRIVQLNGNVFFSKRDRKLTEEVDELSDEYIPDDWEQVIRDAATAGNYRLAVRHTYRYLLSLLRDNERIDYQVAKTNYQYVLELAGTPLHKPFRQLTHEYEYAWYGGFAIPEEHFKAYYSKVTELKNELDPKR